jgi:hypothetical protein
MASKVSLQGKKGDLWALSSVKGKKNTYTIRAVSFQMAAADKVSPFYCCFDFDTL